MLLIFAYTIRRRAELPDELQQTGWVLILSWVITGFHFINTLGNLTSQSVGERIVFTPISLCLLIMCLVVSLSVPEPQLPETNTLICLINPEMT